MGLQTPSVGVGELAQIPEGEGRQGAPALPRGPRVKLSSTLLTQSPPEFPEGTLKYVIRWPLVRWHLRAAKHLLEDGISRESSGGEKTKEDRCPGVGIAVSPVTRGTTQLYWRTTRGWGPVGWGSVVTCSLVSLRAGGAAVGRTESNAVRRRRCNYFFHIHGQTQRRASVSTFPSIEIRRGRPGNRVDRRAFSPTTC